MWNQHRETAAHAWRRCRADVGKRRMTRTHARFWEELHAGEREAEAQTRPADAAKPLAGPTSQGRDPRRIQR
jgi:hypothetical protein